MIPSHGECGVSVCKCFDTVKLRPMQCSPIRDMQKCCLSFPSEGMKYEVNTK